jgi:AcrR family transcriptional regulator
MPIPVRRDLREAILDATERLLARKGYRQMTMDDIAAESCVARRTIYLHFPGKEQVALDSIDRVVERLLERLRAAAAEASPPEERLRAMLRTRVLFRFDSVKDYHHSFTEMFAAIRPAYLVRRESYFAAEAVVFAKVLEEGRLEGALQFEDAEMTARTLLLATNALLPFSLSARELGERVEVEDRVTRLANLVVAGLRTNR